MELLLPAAILSSFALHGWLAWVAGVVWLWPIARLALGRPPRRLPFAVAAAATLIAAVQYAIPAAVDWAGKRFDHYVDSQMQAIPFGTPCSELPKLLPGHESYMVFRGKAVTRFDKKGPNGPYEHESWQLAQAVYPLETYMFDYRVTGLAAAEPRSDDPAISFECDAGGRVTRKRSTGDGRWLSEPQQPR